MIQIEQLTAGRGDFSLGPIDLDLGEGSYLTILGPSGSGKTLFLETCMGLLDPRSGSIKLEGKVGKGALATVILPAEDKLKAVA